MKKSKRLIALLLILSMISVLLVTEAFAADDRTDSTDIPSENNIGDSSGENSDEISGEPGTAGDAETNIRYSAGTYYIAYKSNGNLFSYSSAGTGAVTKRTYGIWMPLNFVIMRI